MPRFTPFIILAALAAFTVSGLYADAVTLVRFVVLALLGGVLLVAILREAPGPSWTQYVLALAVTGFANLSGIGFPFKQTWGPSGSLLFHGISFVGFLALYILCVRSVRSRRWEIGVSIALLCTLLGAGALGGLRFVRLQKLLNKAEAQIQSGSPAAAENSIEQACSGNATLRWKPVELQSHRLLTTAYRQEGRWDLSLREMSQYLLDRRKPDLLRAGAALRLAGLSGREYFQFYADYLQPVSLDVLYEKYSKPDQAAYFKTIHESSSKDRSEDAELLLLFLRNGYIDRFAERYASAGFPEELDLHACEEALVSHLKNHPKSNALAAWYLLGLVRFRAGDYVEALAALEEALKIEPGHHNAIVIMERIAAILERKDLLEQTRAKKRRLTLDMLAGNRRWGMNLDDVLWTALEVNRGTYRLTMQVRGTAAAGINPAFSIYCGRSDVPIYRSDLKSGKWQTVHVEKHFDAEDCPRLLLCFENDSYCLNSKGQEENRSVQFEPVQVEYVPDIMLDTSGTLRQN